MKCFRSWLRDMLLFVCILSLCFCISVLMQYIFDIPEQITTTFAFAVFLIAMLTDGYFWGLFGALTSMLLVNYAFTFPYFEFDFRIRSNFYSALVMALIAVLTSMLTTKIKRQEAIKSETEKEKMRANLLRAISHDLRTPLTTIYGSSAALRENADTLTEEQKDKMLLGIQQDAQWLVRMVENLLSVTRMDGGNVQIFTVVTAVDELVDSALVKFRKRYPDQKAVLDLPQEPALISIDCIKNIQNELTTIFTRKRKFFHEAYKHHKERLEAFRMAESKTNVETWTPPKTPPETRNTPTPWFAKGQNKKQNKSWEPER